MLGLEGWKQALVAVGYPAEDLAAGYVTEPCLSNCRLLLTLGATFNLREYQHQARNFYQSGHVQGGSGVIALPCGAGKTDCGDGGNGGCQRIPSSLPLA